MPATTDVSARAFWQRPAPERDADFARLRAEDPVSWQRTPETPLVPPELTTGGYWAVTTYDDVRFVSRHPELFCSGQGIMFEDIPPAHLETSQSILAMDAPRHTRVRSLVTAAFTPRQVRLLEEGIAATAREIVDRVLEEREGDFVQAVSRELPMRTIAQMLGVPESERGRVAQAAEAMVSWNDPAFVGDRQPLEVVVEGFNAITALGLELAAHRRARPRDDLMAALVSARIDGEGLGDAEISAFFTLLAVGGNDTTRHSASHGIVALGDHPGQRAHLLEDLKVVMFYTSANRDETAFAEPGRFDVMRSPNHHVGFGGGGPHYCLGASLARTQLRCIFSELLRRAPALEVGDPEPLLGSFINGVRTLPYWVG